MRFTVGFAWALLALIAVHLASASTFRTQNVHHARTDTLAPIASHHSLLPAAGDQTLPGLTERSTSDDLAGAPAFGTIRTPGWALDHELLISIAKRHSPRIAQVASHATAHAWTRSPKLHDQHIFWPRPSTEQTYEGGFACLFLLPAYFFLKRLNICVQERPLSHCIFHGLACISVLTMAITHSLAMVDMPALIAWQYVGRLVTSASLVVGLGYINTKPMSHICVPLVLAIAAWVSLGAAAVSAMAPERHCALALSGIVAGTLALCTLSAFSNHDAQRVVLMPQPSPTRRTSMKDHEKDKRGLLDMVMFCNAAYLLMWFVRGWSPLGDIFLNGIVDVAYSWGVNHLLLKRDKLLNAVCNVWLQESEGQKTILIS